MARSRRATKIIARIALCLLGIALILVIAVMIAEAVADKSARTLPSYKKVDITETLEKEVWTEEDYELLYLQTGLGKPALDALKGNTKYLLEFQEALYYDGKFIHDDYAAFATPHDRLKDFIAPIASLEEGDILVTSSCHTFGWRNGHAAVVTDADAWQIVESVAPGTQSTISDTSWFQSSANFMVLRLKDTTREARAEIAEWAEKNLVNLPYSLFTGIFTPKDQGENLKATHCAHLVWQAYKQFGYDIDSDGGLICTVNDIARSDLLEVVQVFGFDPIKLW